MRIPYPPHEDADPRDWQRYHQEMTKAVQALADRITPRTNTQFTLSNVGATYTMDANTISAADLADFVGTLTQALKDSNYIK